MQENATDEQAPENDDEAHATDEQAPGEKVINNPDSESEMEEISTGTASSVFMAQVCLFSFNSRTSFQKEKMVLNDFFF